MAANATQIICSTVFIVEGHDEEQFFEAFLNHLGLGDRVQIIQVGGVTNIRGALKAIRNTPGFPSVRSLCVIRDADRDAIGAFTIAKSSLVSAGLPSPNAVFSLANSNIITSIIVLPDGVNPGFLEDLCLLSVANDPVMPCVTAFGQCVSALGFTPTQRAKALVQVYLTAKGRTAFSVGRASASGYWQWADTAFLQLSNFLPQVVR